MSLYKGYVETKGKRTVEKLKGRTKWKKLDEVKDLNGYAGVLADDTILVDIDDHDQSEIMMKIVEDYQLDCRVYQTTRGRHFLFKNHQVSRNRTHIPLAVGLTADIKIGTRCSYEVIKIDGVERFVEWDVEEGKDYQELPKWFLPVRATNEFVDMEAGEGRNQALFNYILTLTANDFSVDDTRETIRILNKYVLKDPLGDEELETILRDEAFQKPVFFLGATFLFEKFATFLKNNNHIVRINNQLHIYKEGVYLSGYRNIEAVMIEHIPNLKKTQRRECLEYLELIAEDYSMSEARFIAFNNGIYDLVEDTLNPFSPEIVVTNKIPWDYVADAYDELTDKTLNKLACNDPDIRALLEECIGYCMYRRNELGKAFILTGEKSNGKSTYLKMVKNVLGDKNISALDLKELGDRFSTAMMFNKLANIGDDIGDDFLQGSQVAIFKKVVTGEMIKAERKGLDPFEFTPYTKLLFSANDIPRMRDKTGAVLRRLEIIPFNASFTKDDPDFDSKIVDKLTSQDASEYLVNIAVKALQRVRTMDEFTKSERVEKEREEYRIENNPILGFIAEVGKDDIVNESTTDVYKRYQVYCADASMQPLSKAIFSKQINRELNLETATKRINGKVIRCFVPFQS